MTKSACPRFGISCQDGRADHGERMGHSGDMCVARMDMSANKSPFPIIHRQVSLRSLTAFFFNSLRDEDDGGFHPPYPQPGDIVPIPLPRFAR